MMHIIKFYSHVYKFIAHSINQHFFVLYTVVTALLNSMGLDYLESINQIMFIGFCLFGQFNIISLYASFCSNT